MLRSVDAGGENDATVFPEADGRWTAVGFAQDVLEVREFGAGNGVAGRGEAVAIEMEDGDVARGETEETLEDG